MQAITYSDARSKLTKVMDRVCSDHDPVIITRGKKDAVVMMSLGDFESWEETMYLLKSPANAERLRKSVANLTKGKHRQRELIEE
ncbi:MAG: type II toxin-antitoxin system Phd/YefM family antitoxin [Puniceicoccales bacterium]